MNIRPISGGWEIPQSKYSPVGSISLMLDLVQKDMIDRYLLLLAHDVVKHKQDTACMVDRLPHNSIVILDNSLIELGNAVNFEIMMEAVKASAPDFIVLPDVLMNKEATIREAGFVYKQWLDLLRQHRRGDSRFMAVVQGEDRTAMHECAQSFMEMDTHNMIGAFAIPRAFANKWGSRKDIIADLYESYQKPIHLLGFSEHFDDDMYCAANPVVMGIDSATPMRLGFERDKLNIAYPDKLEGKLFCPRNKFFTEALDANKNMIYNIAYIRGVIDGIKRGWTS